MYNQKGTRLAYVLKWLVFCVCAVNLLALVTLPFWLSAIYTGQATQLLGGGAFNLAEYIPVREDFTLMLVFLAVCGVVTMTALVLAFLALKNICSGAVFCQKNVKLLNYIAICALVLAAVGVCKLILQFTLYSIIFVAIFLLAALFLFVLARIFYAATCIKEENDLMI